jgi:triphosphoribosyl-dephospho-CoA synthetase
MANDGRKSLMITKEVHAKLTSLADTFDVSQPELVEAMLQCVDNLRLRAKLQELQAQRKLTVEEQNKKFALVREKLKDMTPAQVEELLRGLGS